jgi:protein LSM14
MPIPISIPVHPRPAKPTTTQTPATKPTPTISPHPVVDTAKVTTAADVQTLAKNLSETKLTSNNAPGAGGYLTHQPRRRQFGAGASRSMDRDYDFESGNAKFNKEDVKKEVAAQAGVNGAIESGPSAAQLSAALAATEEPFYDKGKSFFDNISCENKDRSGGPSEEGIVNPNSWKRGEERKLNMETFGQASVDYGSGRFGRGGFRGGRGGYRGARGGGGYYGGRGRGGPPSVRGGHWGNGQPSSATTT